MEKTDLDALNVTMDSNWLMVNALAMKLQLHQLHHHQHLQLFLLHLHKAQVHHHHQLLAVQVPLHLLLTKTMTMFPKQQHTMEMAKVLIIIHQLEGTNQNKQASLLVNIIIFGNYAQ